MFTGQRRGDFHEFLRARLAPEYGSVAADDLLSSRIAPSRQLLSVAAEEIQQREVFTLLDEQRVAFELVLAQVRQAAHADMKTVVVITGGPGSGKSVIALSLLGQLAREGRTVMHSTGSRSFTQILRAVAGKGSSRYRSLFAYASRPSTAGLPWTRSSPPPGPSARLSTSLVEPAEDDDVVLGAPNRTAPPT